MGGVCGLYLHHLGHGERVEAEWWRRQVGLETSTSFGMPGWVARDDVLGTLHLQEVLRDGEPDLFPVFTAVLAYFPDVIGDVDGVGLFFPEEGFPDRIEEFTV